MKKNKAIKYRIYPNEAQRQFFANTFGCCRKIWNLMLDAKITHYEQTGKKLQICHSCGKKHPQTKDLSLRTIVCECGYTNDRDINAAMNIRDEALRILQIH